MKPDLPYYDAMDLVHRHLVPRTYVEIGVSTGRTLRLALPGTRCVGIDPEPHLEQPLAPDQQVFAQTSDEFFAGHDLGAVLGGAPMDLAFIDGMHHFEFALRDFINLERASHPDTTVLIHDCLPQSEEGAARERTTVLWSGDVWRLIVALREWRPDLDVAVAAWALAATASLAISNCVFTVEYGSPVAIEASRSSTVNGTVADCPNQ